MAVGGQLASGGGTGVVNMSGGTLNVTGPLQIWNTPGSGVAFRAGS